MYFRMLLTTAVCLAVGSPVSVEAAPEPVKPAALYKEAARALKAGKKVKAAESYEKFLKSAGVEVGGFASWKRKKQAKKKLKRLRARLASFTLTSPVEGAMLLVNTKHRGTTPLPHRLYFWPGKHKLELVKSGHVTVFKELKLKRGEHLVLNLELPKEAVVVKPKVKKKKKTVRKKAKASSVKPKGSPIYKKWWFWTAIGTVVVVTGVTAGVMANQPGEEPEMGVITFK